MAPTAHPFTYQLLFSPIQRSLLFLKHISQNSLWGSLHLPGARFLQRLLCLQDGAQFFHFHRGFLWSPLLKFWSPQHHYLHCLLPFSIIHVTTTWYLAVIFAYCLPFSPRSSVKRNHHFCFLKRALMVMKRSWHSSASLACPEKSQVKLSICPWTLTHNILL